MSEKALSLIDGANSFLLLAHHSPDIDSIASAVALGLALESKGKKVVLSSTGTISDKIVFFTEQLGMKLTDADYSVDCIFVLDTNSPTLFDFESVKASSAKKILIDHHSPKPEVMEEFDECIINEHAVSTTQIIYSLLREMNYSFSREAAIAVSAGIVTDSANFIAATPEAFKVLYESLSEAGVSFQEVLKAITVPIDPSLKIAKLKGAQRLSITREGDYIIVTSKVSSFEGSVARSLLGLGADVAFVGATKEGEARISARARNELVEKGLHLGRDILPPLSELIGGDAGGHAAAAGANGTNPDGLDRALSKCVSKTREFIKSI